MRSLPVLVLGFLFVSFRPSPLRSHSCSTSAYLVLSLSVFSASLPVPFVPFCSASGYLALCSSVPFFLASPLQRLLQCPGSSFRLPRFPPSLPPGFPCFCSGFRYLAFCSFPFILPGFAPTAVPPVLPFCSASLRPLLSRAFLPAFRFLSSPSACF